MLNLAWIDSLRLCLSLSLEDLEGKVKWLDNYQKVKQLKEALVWPPVWERDKRAQVPEVNIQIYMPWSLTTRD